MKATRYIYNIGFTVNGVEDATEFDTSFRTYEYAVVDLINCFLEFIRENNFENVEVEYIEYLREEKEE